MALTVVAVFWYSAETIPPTYSYFTSWVCDAHHGEIRPAFASGDCGKNNHNTIWFSDISRKLIIKYEIDDRVCTSVVL